MLPNQPVIRKDLRGQEISVFVYIVRMYDS